MGIVPSPFDCYQVNRGLKTLALRMRQHSHNALRVAMYLEKHPSVEKVLHPGMLNKIIFPCKFLLPLWCHIDEDLDWIW